MTGAWAGAAGVGCVWSVLGPATSVSVPGGVVIFAVNSLLYLNQSVPPYGVALNSLTTGTTAFPLRECWGAGPGVAGAAAGPG